MPKRRVSAKKRYNPISQENRKKPTTAKLRLMNTIKKTSRNGLVIQICKPIDGKAIKTRGRPSKTSKLEEADDKMEVKEMYEIPDADGVSHIEKLPDEIIMDIFKNLDHDSLMKAGTTCKRFHGITQDNSFVTNFITIREMRITQDIWREILAKKPYYLTLEKCKFDKDVTMPVGENGEELIEQINNIRVLNIKKTNIPAEFLMKMMKCSRERMESFILQSYQLTIPLRMEISKLVNLKVLGLPRCKGFACVALKEILDKCPKIVKLNLFDVHCYKGISNLIMRKANPDMQVLEMRVVDFDDNAMLRLISRFENLHYLRMRNCILSSKSMLLAVFAHVQPLTFMELRTAEGMEHTRVLSEDEGRDDTIFNEILQVHYCPDFELLSNPYSLPRYHRQRRRRRTSKRSKAK